MRYRSRTTNNVAVPATAWVDRYYHVSDGSDFGGSSGYQGASATGTNTEVIEDQGVVAYGVKPVTHSYSAYRRSENALRLLNWTYNNGADRVVMTSGYISLWDLGVGYTCPPRIEASDISIVYPKTVEQLRSQAMHSFFDVNQTDNLLNVLEAGQLVSSVKGIYDLLYRLTRPNALANAGKGVDLTRGIGQLTKDLSDQFLAYQFGFAPLVSDLKKIAHELPKIRQRLRQLARNAAAPYTRTAKCYGTYSLNIAPGKQSGYSSSDNPNDGTWWHARLLPEVIPVRTVGVRGKRAVEWQTDSFAELDYLLGRYIATGPVSLLWEKIKFSFVVDWFIDLTSLIDKLDNTLVSNGKKIDRCWTSEKYAFLVPCYKHRQGQFVFPCDGQQVALSECKYYHREPLVPDISIQNAGRFGKKQGLLTLALFRQLAANLRK